MNTLRVAAVAAKVGMGESTIWQWSRRGDFPKPFYLNKNIAVWDEAEVDKWLADKKEKQHGSTSEREAEAV